MFQLLDTSAALHGEGMSAIEQAAFGFTVISAWFMRRHKLRAFMFWFVCAITDSVHTFGHFSSN